MTCGRYSYGRSTFVLSICGPWTCGPSTYGLWTYGLWTYGRSICGRSICGPFSCAPWTCDRLIYAQWTSDRCGPSTFSPEIDELSCALSNATFQSSSSLPIPTPPI